MIKQYLEKTMGLDAKNRLETEPNFSLADKPDANIIRGMRGSVEANTSSILERTALGTREKVDIPPPDTSLTLRKASPANSSISVNNIGGANTQIKTYRHLSRREAQIVEAYLEVLLPPGSEDVPISGKNAGGIEYFDRHLELLPGDKRKLLKMALWVLEYSPWILGPCKSRFTLLPPEEQRKMIDPSPSIYGKESKNLLHKISKQLAETAYGFSEMAKRSKKFKIVGYPLYVFCATVAFVLDLPDFIDYFVRNALRAGLRLETTFGYCANQKVGERIGYIRTDEKTLDSYSKD